MALRQCSALLAQTSVRTALHGGAELGPACSGTICSFGFFLHQKLVIVNRIVQSESFSVPRSSVEILPCLGRNGVSLDHAAITFL